MSYKGRFRPKNHKKYKGDPTKVYYRSLWERRFMHYCDNTPSILEWNSEEIIIPYVSPLDNRIHRYFPDFYIKVRNVSGTVRREIIEVKPKRQCEPPKVPKRTKCPSHVHVPPRHGVSPQGHCASPRARHVSRP